MVYNSSGVFCLWISKKCVLDVFNTLDEVVSLHQSGYRIMKLPGQDSGYTMVVAMSLVPIGLHQNCRHQISHWMVHLEALQVPSIQADI